MHPHGDYLEDFTWPKTKVYVRNPSTGKMLTFDPCAEGDALILRSQEMGAFLDTSSMEDLNVTVSFTEEDWGIYVNRDGGPPNPPTMQSGQPL